MIIIHAAMRLQPGKDEAFLKEILPLVEASRGESGNVSYDLYKHAEKEHAYTMVEVWKDQQAVASHNSSAPFKAFTGKASEFLAAPLDVKVYAAEAVKV
ncbi:putative quinol monooxygenase [Paenibacillus chitinolyticus]|uniref:putative quinol monooxygenase n=1 Tax=Paenibacillus chitinolyticus TaxID=79263 RepID=UPI001C4954BE|nr:putative quinol monooxygenase [Paenibacillus chitinolyticus]MBV6716585.1 antibiotic biosynthesis monooxygenase [Paenibacillus chitinolyticus]